MTVENATHQRLRAQIASMQKRIHDLSSSLWKEVLRCFENRLVLVESAVTVAGVRAPAFLRVQ